MTLSTTLLDGITADHALQKLKDGNQRFFSESSAKVDLGETRRAELCKGQFPFAIIVCCSDSRIPPEFIFNQGLGDLFVVRVAAGILDDIAIGSIEYAVEHLGAPLIVVLGHEDCGAIKAAVAGGETHGHITTIVNALIPAVDRAKTQIGDLLHNSIKVHNDMMVKKIQLSQPIIKKFVDAGKVKVVGAIYDMHGRVIFD